MITGSTASALYGEPRARQDIDIVIDPQPGQLSALLDALKDGFYVSAEAASVLVGCAGELDMDYIRREAELAGVTELLARILPARADGGPR